VAIIGAGLERSFEPLARQAAVVVCQASADVIRRLEAEHGVRFARDAADLLRQTAGADAARLRADVERVLLYAAGRTLVTREHVQDVVGSAKAAGNLWRAVADRRTAVALKELELELAEGAVPYMVLGLLRSVVERTVASKDVVRALDALLHTDVALKTSGGEPRVLLERLIVDLCAMGRE
jgi:DNA polymerase III delta subunit